MVADMAFVRCFACAKLHLAVDASELGDRVEEHVRCSACGGAGFFETEPQLDELWGEIPACVRSGEHDCDGGHGGAT